MELSFDADGEVATTGGGSNAVASFSSSNYGNVVVVAVEEEKKKQQRQQQRHRAIISVLSIISTITVISSVCTPPPAYAAAKTATAAAATAAGQQQQHLHTGQKIANYFRSFGIPDLAVLAIISAMPVVELRGAVPVGVWMGLPIAQVLPVCVLGNMVPIVPILLLLRNERLK